MRAADRLSFHCLRRRLPFPAVVLVLVFLVVVLGFVCVCMSDHPTQAAEQALVAFAHAPAVVELAAVAAVLLAAVFLEPTSASLSAVSALGRGSPARLQRFRL